MPTLRIANANLEWMNYWFTNDSDAIGWRPTFTQDGQTYQTAETAQREAAMIRAIDPDRSAHRPARRRWPTYRPRDRQGVVIVTPCPPLRASRAVTATRR